MAYRFTDPSGFPYKSGKLFLGLDPATGQEIGIRLERHALTIGGSRTGKGAALLVPNARRWPQNLLCIDTKGENAALSWQDREAMGQQVCILDPLDSVTWQDAQNPQGAPRRLRATFNPLASVDPTSRRARAKLSAIGNGLVVVHDPAHMEWVQGARSILAGICAYVVVDAPPEERSFAAVRSILMQKNQIVNEDGELVGGLYHTAQLMADDNRCGGLIREAGVTIMTALESEKGMEKDFLGGARRATSWLDDEGIAETLGSSSFDLDDLKNGAVSVFLVLPADPDTMATYAPFLRLFVKTALNSMSDGGSGSGKGKHCLFLLDEFYSLGKMPEIIEASGRMPSYGVHLWPFMQDLGQLKDLYGENGSGTLFGAADAAIFFGNDEPATLEYISRRLGKLTPEEIAAPPAQDAAHVDMAHASAVPTDKPNDWFPMAGYVAASNENERRRVEQANETRRRAVDLENARRRAEYDHAMKRVGSPRLSPDEIAALVGKGQKDDLARSMIVFVPGGVVLNLLLAPYFQTPHQQTTARNQTAASTQEPDYISPTAGPCYRRRPDDKFTFYTLDGYRIEPDRINKVVEWTIQQISPFLTDEEKSLLPAALDDVMNDISDDKLIDLIYDKPLKRHWTYIQGIPFLMVWHDETTKASDLPIWFRLRNYSEIIVDKVNFNILTDTNITVENAIELQRICDEFCYIESNESRRIYDQMPWTNWFPELSFHVEPFNGLYCLYVLEAGKVPEFKQKIGWKTRNAVSKFLNILRK